MVLTFGFSRTRSTAKRVGSNPLSGSILVSELCAKSLASNAADYKSLLGIAQIFLCPVYRTTVNELQSLAGSGCGVDMEAEVEVVSSATRSPVVDCTIDVLELRPDRLEKPRFKGSLTCILMEIGDREMQRHTGTQVDSKCSQIESDVQVKRGKLESQAASISTGAAQCERTEMSEQMRALVVLGAKQSVTGCKVNGFRRPGMGA